MVKTLQKICLWKSNDLKEEKTFLADKPVKHAKPLCLLEIQVWTWYTQILHCFKFVEKHT